jgi:iron complex transport system substrate-binding protein
MIMAGCQGKQQPATITAQDLQYPDTSLRSVKYAKGFRFERDAEGTILILSDPIKAGKEIARYRFLKTKSGVKPLEGYTDIVVPVKRLAASSTTHAGFLSAIGAGDQLMGCNNPERLYDTLLFNRFLKGDLVRMGRDLEYNLEYLIASKPDLVLQTGIDGQFNPDARLTGMGIPVMYVLEWMESTPLGRAEWIKVFGLVTGEVRVADSLFNLIEKNYLFSAKLGRESPDKIKVLTGNVFKGTWYMPGGKNYMARFFEDAGMDYLYENTDQSASLALSFESVVYQLAEAPVWINVNVDSLSQLLAAEPRYSVFRAMKDCRVFSVFNRVNAHGGNDFWESAVVRPDKVLADLLAIAHPELIPDHIWNYYKPLVFN